MTWATEAQRSAEGLLSSAGPIAHHKRSIEATGCPLSLTEISIADIARSASLWT